MKLQIRDVNLTWWPKGGRGQLFVANPGEKPLSSLGDGGLDELVQSACEQGIKNVVVPTSLLAQQAGMIHVATGKNDCRLLFLKDVFEFNVEEFFPDTPFECLREIYAALQKGQDVLLISATNEISGFLPAALSVLEDPNVHIIKVIYPITQNEGYLLTTQQIAYLYGFSDALKHQLAEMDMS